MFATKSKEKITKEKLKQHISVLAADSLEGREVGEPGETKAANYISNYFKNIGIPTYKDSTYYQEIPLQKRETKNANIKIQKTEYAFKEDFYTYPNFGDTDIDSEDILFLGYGIDSENYNDYNTNTKGKVIVIFNGEPKDESCDFNFLGCAR